MWAVARTVVLAWSLLWLLGLWLFVPELRLGMRAYIGCLWVVVAWFALARTKTLTWSGFLGYFALCVPWSVGIGLSSSGVYPIYVEDGDGARWERFDLSTTDLLLEILHGTVISQLFSTIFMDTEKVFRPYSYQP